MTTTDAIDQELEDNFDDDGIVDRSDEGDLYHCNKCGLPITAAEADDNGGDCEQCAAGR